MAFFYEQKRIFFSILNFLSLYLYSLILKIMKVFIYTLVISFFVFISCDSSKNTVKTPNTLEGSWQLSYISGPRIAFDGLYPDKKPTIVFDLKENKISGNNSCNQYFGALLLDGNKINFKDAKIGMTMMACQGTGEGTYMKILDKIDSYSLSQDGKTLHFIMGNITMMSFQKIITK